MPATRTPWQTSPPLEGTALYSSVKFGNLKLKHRLVQLFCLKASCTRQRCETESPGVHIPGNRVLKYYEDRASDGGLQLTEATDISLYASGYPGVPGVFTRSQLAAWRQITDSVHSKGGYIFVQLWHTGRASSAAMRGGQRPVSSGELPMSGQFLDGTDCAAGPPRSMTVEEIQSVTKEWATAARRSVEEAGFDGVEVHSANGYLLDQFLQDNINARTDEYGGSAENRCRFTLEVIRAVCDAVGSERVGVRLSPYSYFQDTRDSDPELHWTYLCQQLVRLHPVHRPLYVHMIEPRFDEVLNEEQKLASLKLKTRQNSLTLFRDVLRTGGIKFLACGSFNRDSALAKIEDDGADLVAFGRQFIANPDLVDRLRNGWDLNEYHRATFYGADPPEKGYNDYPFHEGAE